MDSCGSRQDENRIVAKVESLPALCDKLAAEVVAAEEQRKTALQALFQSMLHQLMTGQVRVGDLHAMEDSADGA